MEYEKKTCIDNIYFLSKKKGVKIGDIEARANVSAGYISRLGKEDNKTPLSLEIILAASELLSVSIESLLSFRFDSIISTQEYLLTFIEKLITDTEQSKLRWDCETANYLKTLEPDINGEVAHPLFKYIETWTPGETDYPDKIDRPNFASRSFGSTTLIAGNCFNLRMKNYSTLYIMKVVNDDGRINSKEVIEIWLHLSGGINRYLCDNSDVVLKKPIDGLYEVLQEDSKHPKMEEDVKYVINAFMKGVLNDENDDEEDTPF